MLTSYDCIFMLLEVIYTLTVYKIINVFFTNKKINSVYEKILQAIYNIAVVAVYLKFNIPLLTIVANFIFILLLLSLIYDDTFKRKFSVNQPSMANLPIRQLKNKYLIIGKAGEMMCTHKTGHINIQFTFMDANLYKVGGIHFVFF